MGRVAASPYRAARIAKQTEKPEFDSNQHACPLNSKIFRVLPLQPAKSDTKLFPVKSVNLFKRGPALDPPGAPLTLTVRLSTVGSDSAYDPSVSLRNDEVTDGRAAFLPSWAMQVGMDRFFNSLRLGSVIGDRRHDQDAGSSDQKFGENPPGGRFQNEVRNNREVDSDAKHLERLLTAFDQRPPNGRLQYRRIDRYQPRHDDDQDRQMQETIGCEIGFVVGVKGPEQSARNYCLELGQQPRQCHYSRKKQIHHAEVENEAGADQEMQRSGSAQRQPRAEHKEKLPRERVEIPNPRWIGGKVPAKLPGGDPEQD